MRITVYVTSNLSLVSRKFTTFCLAQVSYYQFTTPSILISREFPPALSTIFEELASSPIFLSLDCQCVNESPHWHIGERCLSSFEVPGYARCYEAAILFPVIYLLASQEVSSFQVPTMSSACSSTSTLVSDQHSSGSVGLPPLPPISGAQITHSSLTTRRRGEFEVPPSDPCQDNEGYAHVSSQVIGFAVTESPA